MADRSLVESVTNSGRQIGGSSGHGLADRGIWHGFEESVGLVAALHTAAQGFGLLDPGFDGGLCGSFREDQNDRTHLILEALGLLFVFIVALDLDGLGDVLLTDLQALLVSPAVHNGPNPFGLHASLQRIGPNALAF